MNLSAILYGLTGSTEDFVSDVFAKHFGMLSVPKIHSAEELSKHVGDDASEIIFFHLNNLPDLEPVHGKLKNKKPGRKTMFVLLYNRRSLPLEFDYLESLGFEFFLEVPFAPQKLVHFIRSRFTEAKEFPEPAPPEDRLFGGFDDEIVETLNEASPDVNSERQNEMAIVESELNPAEALLADDRVEREAENPARAKARSPAPAGNPFDESWFEKLKTELKVEDAKSEPEPEPEQTDPEAFLVNDVLAPSPSGADEDFSRTVPETDRPPTGETTPEPQAEAQNKEAVDPEKYFLTDEDTPSENDILDDILFQPPENSGKEPPEVPIEETLDFLEIDTEEVHSIDNPPEPQADFFSKSATEESKKENDLQELGENDEAGLEAAPWGEIQPPPNEDLIAHDFGDSPVQFSRDPGEDDMLKKEKEFIDEITGTLGENPSETEPELEEPHNAECFEKTQKPTEVDAEPLVGEGDESVLTLREDELEDFALDSGEEFIADESFIFSEDESDELVPVGFSGKETDETLDETDLDEGGKALSSIESPSDLKPEELNAQTVESGSNPADFEISETEPLPVDENRIGLGVAPKEWGEINELSIDDIRERLDENIKEFEENYNSEIARDEIEDEAIDASESAATANPISDAEKLARAEVLSKEFETFNFHSRASESPQTTPEPGEEESPEPGEEESPEPGEEESPELEYTLEEVDRIFAGDSENESTESEIFQEAELIEGKGNESDPDELEKDETHPFPTGEPTFSESGEEDEIHEISADAAQWSESEDGDLDLIEEEPDSIPEATDFESSFNEEKIDCSGEETSEGTPASEEFTEEEIDGEVIDFESLSGIPVPIESEAKDSSSDPSGLQDSISELTRSVKEEYSSLFSPKHPAVPVSAASEVVENRGNFVSEENFNPEENLEEIPLRSLFNQTAESSRGSAPPAKAGHPEEKVTPFDSLDEPLSFSMDNFDQLKESTFSGELPEPSINPDVFSFSPEEISGFTDLPLGGDAPKIKIIADEEIKSRIYRYSEKEISHKLNRFESKIKEMQESYSLLKEDLLNPDQKGEK